MHTLINKCQKYTLNPHKCSAYDADTSVRASSVIVGQDHVHTYMLLLIYPNLYVAEVAKGIYDTSYPVYQPEKREFLVNAKKEKSLVHMRYVPTGTWVLMSD